MSIVRRRGSSQVEKVFKKSCKLPNGFFKAIDSGLLWEGMEDTEEYLDKLRAVFEAFDTEKRGFITVDHFVDLARDHFGAEETQSQVRYMYTILPLF